MRASLQFRILVAYSDAVALPRIRAASGVGFHGRHRRVNQQVIEIKTVTHLMHTSDGILSQLAIQCFFG
jgi:hypothetical protein